MQGMCTNVCVCIHTCKTLLQLAVHPINLMLFWYNSNLLLLMVSKYSLVWLDHSSFSHSATNEPPKSSVTKGAVDILECMFHILIGTFGKFFSWHTSTHSSKVTSRISASEKSITDNPGRENPHSSLPSPVCLHLCYRVFRCVLTFLVKVYLTGSSLSARTVLFISEFPESGTRYVSDNDLLN